jgi:hypothetical protein
MSTGKGGVLREILSERIRLISVCDRAMMEACRAVQLTPGHPKGGQGCNLQGPHQLSQPCKPLTFLHRGIRKYAKWRKRLLI